MNKQKEQQHNKHETKAGNENVSSSTTPRRVFLSRPNRIVPTLRQDCTKEVPTQIVPSRMCSMCLRDYKSGDYICYSQHTVSCRHDFHIECLINWLMRNNECPMCRAAFFRLHLTMNNHLQVFEKKLHVRVES